MRKEGLFHSSDSVRAASRPVPLLSAWESPHGYPGVQELQREENGVVCTWVMDNSPSHLHREVFDGFRIFPGGYLGW